MKKVYNYFLNFFRKRKNRRILNESSKQLEVAVQQEIINRTILRKDINNFLVDYFGVKGRSKYIPKSFKNSEEVKAAIQQKFSDRMQSLNISYNDIFE